MLVRTVPIRKTPAKDVQILIAGSELAVPITELNS